MVNTPRRKIMLTVQSQSWVLSDLFSLRKELVVTVDRFLTIQAQCSAAGQKGTRRLGGTGKNTKNRAVDVVKLLNKSRSQPQLE